MSCAPRMLPPLVRRQVGQQVAVLFDQIVLQHDTLQGEGCALAGEQRRGSGQRFREAAFADRIQRVLDHGQLARIDRRFRRRFGSRASAKYSENTLP